MKLTIIGSGTCVPSLERSSPSSLISIKDKKILVDCGSGTIHQLARANENYLDIDMVFITHMHIDHLSDLDALIFANNWTPKHTRERDFIVIGPKGFKKFYEERVAVKGNGFKIIVKEIEDIMNFDGFQVDIFKTKHSDTSLGYIFLENNKKLAITGDTEYFEELKNHVKDADVFLCESSFLNEEKSKSIGHMIPRESATAAKNANVKKLVLYHLYPGSDS